MLRTVRFENRTKTGNIRTEGNSIRIEFVEKQ